jgi:hypothetical protein
MAETDILNPTNWRDYGWFNPNPSYSSGRKPTNNRQIQRPRMGPYNSRDLLNGGHIITMLWAGADLATVQRVEKFYHDFKDGYFTYIDVDNAGRHYVGRFTSEPEPRQTANGKWAIQSITFEEYPTARMLQYPCNFGIWGHPLNVADDNLKPRVALMQGNWSMEVSPLFPGGSTSAPAQLEAYNAAPAPGDWAQTQYVGWGFQMNLRLAANLGAINIFLDGTQIVTGLDLSTGNVTATVVGVTLTLVPPIINSLPTVARVQMTNVPLDQHRVKVYAAGASVAGGTAVIYPALEYIY